MVPTDIIDSWTCWPARVPRRAAARIRPRGRAAFLRQRVTEARALEAVRLRRVYLQWMVGASVVTSLAIVPFAVLATSADAARLLAGPAGGPGGAVLPGLALFSLIGAAIGATAMVGVLAAVREDAALARLRQAAAQLSPEQACRVAAALRQQAGDEHREALWVVLETLGGQGAELVPALAPAGSGGEVAAIDGGTAATRAQSCGPAIRRAASGTER